MKKVFTILSILFYLILPAIAQADSNSSFCKTLGDGINAVAKPLTDTFVYEIREEVIDVGSPDYFDPRVNLKVNIRPPRTLQTFFSFLNFLGIPTSNDWGVHLLEMDAFGECKWLSIPPFTRYCARITDSEIYMNKYSLRVPRPTAGGITLDLPKICVFNDPMDLNDWDPNRSPYQELTEVDGLTPALNVALGAGGVAMLTALSAAPIIAPVAAAVSGISALVYLISKYANQCVFGMVGCVDLPLSPAPPPYQTYFNKSVQPVANLMRVCNINDSVTGSSKNLCYASSQPSTFSVARAIIYFEDNNFLVYKCSNSNASNCVNFYNFNPSQALNPVSKCGSNTTTPCIQPVGSAPDAAQYFVNYTSSTKGGDVQMAPYAINIGPMDIISAGFTSSVNEVSANNPSGTVRRLACATNQTPDNFDCVVFNLQNQIVQTARSCKTAAANEACISFPTYYNSNSDKYYTIEYTKNTAGNYQSYSVKDLQYNSYSNPVKLVNTISNTPISENKSLNVNNINRSFVSQMEVDATSICVNELIGDPVLLGLPSTTTSLNIGCVDRPKMPRPTLDACNGSNGCPIITSDKPAVVMQICEGNDCNSIVGMQPKGSAALTDSSTKDYYTYALMGKQFKLTVYNLDGSVINSNGDLKPALTTLAVYNLARESVSTTTTDPVTKKPVTTSTIQTVEKAKYNISIKPSAEFDKFVYKNGANYVCLEPVTGSFDFLAENFLVRNTSVTTSTGIKVPQASILPQEVLLPTSLSDFNNPIDKLNIPIIECRMDNMTILNSLKCSLVRPHPLQLLKFEDFSKRLCIALPTYTQ